MCGGEGFWEKYRRVGGGGVRSPLTFELWRAKKLPEVRAGGITYDPSVLFNKSTDGSEVRQNKKYRRVPGEKSTDGSGKCKKYRRVKSTDGSEI